MSFSDLHSYLLRKGRTLSNRLSAANAETLEGLETFLNRQESPQGSDSGMLDWETRPSEVMSPSKTAESDFHFIAGPYRTGPGPIGSDTDEDRKTIVAGPPFAGSVPSWND